MKNVVFTLFLAACSTTSPLPPVAEMPIMSVDWSEYKTPRKNNGPMIWSYYFYPGEGYGIIKDEYSKQPEGAKTFFEAWAIWKIRENNKDNCTDAKGNLTKFKCPFWDNGIEDTWIITKPMIDWLIQENMPIQYWVWDFESPGQPGSTAGSYWICVEEGHAEAVINDPRAPKIAAMAGIKDLSHICDFSNPESAKITNALFQVERNYLIEIEKRIHALMPNVQVSNFYWMDTIGKTHPGDHNCSMEFEGGNLIGLGAQGPEVYGVTSPEGCVQPGMVNGQVFHKTPFDELKLQLNDILNGVEAAPDKPLHPWYSPQNFYGVIGGVNNPWYKETIIHSLMMNTQVILFWNPHWPHVSEEDLARDDQHFSDIVDEVNSYIGYVDRKSLAVKMIPWDSLTVETCVMANRKKVCRITDPSGNGVWKIE